MSIAHKAFVGPLNSAPLEFEIVVRNGAADLAPDIAGSGLRPLIRVIDLNRDG